jgi:hypothetical protein
VSVRKQFTNDQVTRSRKLQGGWWGDGGAYVVASYARASYGSVSIVLPLVSLTERYDLTNC